MGRAAHIAHKPANVVRVGESRDAGSQIKIRAEAASVAKNVERKVAMRDAH
jgi:hypothetical protein